MEEGHKDIGLAVGSRREYAVEILKKDLLEHHGCLILIPVNFLIAYVELNFSFPIISAN